MSALQKLLLLAAGALLAVMVLWVVYQQSNKPIQLKAAQLLPAVASVADFSLTDHRGKLFGKKELTAGSTGQWQLLFFGYTFCPDVCPLEMQKLGQVLNSLEQDEMQPLPQVIFVSVDPERDSLEQLKNYATYFHSSIIGVTGENSELAKLAKSFAASYNRMAEIDGKKYLVKAGASMPEGSGENYLVGHTSRIFIVSPEGGYVGSFAPPHQAEVLYADIKALIKSR